MPLLWSVATALDRSDLLTPRPLHAFHEAGWEDRNVPGRGLRPIFFDMLYILGFPLQMLQAHCGLLSPGLCGP